MVTSGEPGVGVVRQDFRVRSRGVRRERVAEVSRVGRSSSSAGKMGNLDARVAGRAFPESQPAGLVEVISDMSLVSTEMAVRTQKTG